MGEKEESGRSHRQQEVPPAEEKPTNGTIYDDVFRTMIDNMILKKFFRKGCCFFFPIMS